MATSTMSDSAKKSKKQALANLKAALTRQKLLVQAKTKDLHTFNQRVKKTKGLTMTQKMQNEQIAFSKKSDIYRTKQTLERMKIAYSDKFHKK